MYFYTILHSKGYISQKSICLLHRNATRSNMSVSFLARGNDTQNALPLPIIKVPRSRLVEGTFPHILKERIVHVNVQQWYSNRFYKRIQNAGPGLSSGGTSVNTTHRLLWSALVTDEGDLEVGTEQSPVHAALRHILLGVFQHMVRTAEHHFTCSTESLQLLYSATYWHNHVLLCLLYDNK